MCKPVKITENFFKTENEWFKVLQQEVDVEASLPEINEEDVKRCFDFLNVDLQSPTLTEESTIHIGKGIELLKAISGKFDERFEEDEI